MKSIFKNNILEIFDTGDSEYDHYLGANCYDYIVHCPELDDFFIWTTVAQNWADIKISTWAEPDDPVDFVEVFYKRFEDIKKPQIKHWGGSSDLEYAENLIKEVFSGDEIYNTMREFKPIKN